ncbi:serine hydrolase domain-containing protein [Pontixanthobacter sp. CEM42]|uniref:serine hydrolase domain-containing protein n=1 Tax=Pontixanthobacter sp. CEM42 TaxID=2792077 RepID=UPI001AE077C3|nr:serine hydrolase domain-containing protein [Pontixanthobacter sp. CEM42]
MARAIPPLKTAIRPRPAGSLHKLAAITFVNRDQMKYIRRLIHAALGLVAVALLCSAALYLYHIPVPDLDNTAPADQGIGSADHAELIGAARDSLSLARTALVAPSVSVAVAKDGEVIWSEAIGYADIENRRRATVETVYPIGSVSKPITAALALKLAEEGMVDLDTDIRTYVTEFPEKRQPITLRQLLSHQAGIRHYGFAFAPPTFSEAAFDIEFSDTKQALEIFDDDPLLFAPDTDFSYSTFGYTLASAALEEATGEEFLKLLDTRLFDHLGMESSGPNRPQILGSKLAEGYVGLFFRKRAMPAPQTNESYKWAGGGLASTPTDLAIFGAGLLSDEILTRQAREEMFARRQTSDGAFNEQHYALGWRIGEFETEGSSIRVINHGGATAGATAILLLFPDHDLVIAMSANTVRSGGSNQITSQAAKIASIFLRGKNAQ